MICLSKYKLIQVSTLLPIFIFCLCAFLSQPAKAADTGFDISSYHTEIIIDSENIYHVTEDIFVLFHEPRHGIYRFVPYTQEMLWDMNGINKRVIYNTRVSEINVKNEEYSTYRESGNLVIKIGDPNNTVTGNKEYHISYDHKLGNDKLDSIDFVYYNLVGNNWDCNIENVSFKITLPKEFDVSKISFYSGRYSSVESSSIQFTVENRTISGTLNKSLNPGEGITLQIELPQGYFDTPEPFPFKTFFIIASVLLALLSLVLFFIYGRDPMLIKSVEFYPPDEITSAEAGYIIDTATDDNDVVSLIIYWASKGFLLIEQISRDDFKLSKLKDMSEDRKDYERYMFNQLFYDRESVTISELREGFYVTIDTTKEMITSFYSDPEKRLYEHKSMILRRLLFLFSTLLIWSTMFYALYLEYYSFITSFLISFGSTIIVMLPFYKLCITLTKWNGMKNSKRFTSFIINIIIALLMLMIYIALMYMQNLIVVGLTVALLSAFINIMSVLIRRRTKFGNAILGKLLGFKNFLEVAEKSRLQRLVEENPSYFYDVMPFAYVLGVSDKWAKNFESISMRSPDWYSNSYSQGAVFSPLIFQLSLFQSMAFMQANLISRPIPQVNDSRLGGGGFGGGGFSGGGFGGGGGGSW